VGNRSITLWAQDATVLGGTVGAVHARKVSMIMENVLKNRTPIVALFDSEGIRAEDAIQYPDFYSASSMAYFQTLSSGVVPRVSLVMGPCTGELSLVAALGDFIFMVRSSSFMHLMPPFPTQDSPQIGDAWGQASVTGVCDVLAENDEDVRLAREDRLAALQEKIGKGKRPTVYVDIPERHVGQATIDPAAETEVALFCRELGFRYFKFNFPISQQRGASLDVTDKEIQDNLQPIRETVERLKLKPGEWGIEIFDEPFDQIIIPPPGKDGTETDQS
jgi:hypothetical protein